MFHIPLRPDDKPGEVDFTVVDQGLPPAPEHRMVPDPED